MLKNIYIFDFFGCKITHNKRNGIARVDVAKCNRFFNGKKSRVTDFNDGIKLIGEFRKKHDNEAIYASDCDIRKFYDTINHDVVCDCFQRMFKECGMSDEDAQPLMTILNTYLASFNFYDNVLTPSQDTGFWHRAYHRHQRKDTDECCFEWISDKDGIGIYGSAEKFKEEKTKIGVPQGGALSLIIANVVLNDVDKQAGLPNETDCNRLFVRFCDDMVLLHTNEGECKCLMDAYTNSLTAHKLVYHEFIEVEKFKCDERPDATNRKFWNVKSHGTFLWGDGEGNCNRYIGFLGYEMSRDGVVRLRRSNELKFDDKLSRFYYSVYRKVSDKTEKIEVDKFISGLERSMSYLVESINFYKGLQSFEHSEKQLKRMSRHRRHKIRRIISRLENKKRPLSTKYDENEIKQICESLKQMKKIENGYAVNKEVS